MWGEWSVRVSRRMWGGVECERQGEDVGVEWSVRGSRGVECERQGEDVGVEWSVRGRGRMWGWSGV